MSILRPAAALLCIAPLLGACEGLSRFGGSSPAAIAVAPSATRPAPIDEPIAAPVPQATRRPLAAPGAPTTPRTPLPGDEDGPLVAPGAATADDLSPAAPGVTPPLAPRPPQVAVANPTAPAVATPRPPQPAVPPSASRVVGGWSVAEQNGTSCKLNLSSAPFVDLSRASTSGCSPALSRVNSWKLDGGEIVLYQSGGEVAARLRGSGSNFSGAAVKTGAPVRISR
jgi:hypothetical protein